MKKDLLQAVITVESEIQQNIETERKKAANWLESIRVSLSRELQAKKQQLEKEFARSLETMARELESEASREITAADLMMDHLQKLSENFLQDVVKKFLPQILPTEHR